MNTVNSWLACITVVAGVGISATANAQHRVSIFNPFGTVAGRMVNDAQAAQRQHSSDGQTGKTAKTAKIAKPVRHQRTAVRHASADSPVPEPESISLEPSVIADDSMLAIDGTPLVVDPARPPIPQGWWVHGEYLMWWPRPMQIPALVTSGTTTSEAVLQQDGTTVLVGDKLFDTTYSGGRIRAGFWTNPCAGRGWEFEYFGIGKLTESYTFSGTGATGSTVLARPFFNVLTNTQAPNGREDAELVSYPDQLRGSVTVEASSKLYGIAVHPIWVNCESCGPSILAPCCGPSHRRMRTFIGWRYLNLAEDLSVSENLTSLLESPDDGQFLVNDQFQTRNRFNGADIGVIWQRQRECWTLDLLMRVGIGTTRQDVTIAGSTSIRGSQESSNNFENATGGLLAQRTNIGSYSRSEFSMVPEIGATLGYQLGSHWRFTAGYTLLYWSNVVRPGDQIDRDINPNLLPPEITPLTGLERPQFTFVDTDLWINGLNLGLECQW